MHGRLEGIVHARLVQFDVRAEDPEARRCFDAARALQAEAGQPRLAAYVMMDLAAIAAEEGHLQEALSRYEEAWRGMDALGDRRFSAFLLGCRAAMESTLGRLEAASEHFHAAEEKLLALEERLLGATVRVHRGHEELARARVAMLRGDAELAAALRVRAEARIEEASRGSPDAPALMGLSDDVRFAVRVLRRALEEDHSRVGGLRVAADGAWFQLGDGERVSLESRRTLRGLLAALLEHRVRSPGAPLPTEELLAAGWPGERMLPRAASNRVHVALATLRKLGLRAVLVRERRGCLLDAGVLVEVGDGR